MSRTEVWTIGHGDHDFDDVATALVRNGVQTIVDIRTEPYSKWAPDFTKGDLEQAAASAGFGYRWMGRTLGGRPVPADEVLANGIDELVGLCSSSHVVLLCAEVDPTHCHRDTLLAPALVERGFRVTHILATGEAMPYHDHLDI